jgi:threonine aldolase
MIDLRSDTVTKPSAAMRQAMANAEVGDDVIDIDPTIQKLEKRTAELLGKEAAIYMPSGSMTNQIAIRIHCKPGDEFLCEAGCHIYNYEQAAFAQLSGVVARTIETNDCLLTLDHMQGKIRPFNEHMVRTRLVALENTHNRGSGRVLPLKNVEEICGWASKNGISAHLDGARLFNAVAATGIDASVWAKHFDTVSICFSKGLGAPVGSALAGSKEHILEARRHRKCFGGAMRQGGIIAAGALYALENNRERLAEDHEKAQTLCEAISAAPGLTVVPESIDTNIVIFRVDPSMASAPDFVQAWEQQGVRSMAMGPDVIRAVTHLDVSPTDAAAAGKKLIQLAERYQTAIV